MTDAHQRWYRGYRNVGNASQLVQQIGTVVRNQDLGRYIPVVRFEKRARGQFYFFVAIEGAAHGVIPAEVEQFCGLRLLGQPLPTPFRLEDISSMVSGEMAFEDYARRLPYRPPEAPIDADPFAAEPEPGADDAHSGDVVEKSQMHDRLLMWLSAVGHGSWGVFQAACRTLGLDQNGRQAQQIMRRLRLLGHAETSRDGSCWSIAPTVLVRVSPHEEVGAYALCGARDGPLITALGEFGSIRATPQHKGDGPAAVMLLVTDSETFQQRLAATSLASRVIVEDDIALRLAQLLPPIAGWVELLDPLPTLHAYMYDCLRFDGQAFAEEGFSGRAGFYEIWPPATSATSRAQSPEYRAFYDATTGRWVRGDWYGMRFLAHTVEGNACPVQYDGSSGRLAISSEWRWPELYERVLVLASGRLPVLSESRAWLTYEGVTNSLLGALADKLPLDHFAEGYVHA